MGAADTTKHVTFAIEDRTGIGKFFLTDDSVYAYFIVGEVAWQFTGSGSSYTVSETGSAYSITLAPESTTIVAVDAALSVSSAQLWFSTSDTIVSSDGTVTKPTAGTAEYYYDFVEFACTPSASGTSGVVNIDTTQVDQFGFPITLTVSPADKDFGSTCGISPGIGREEIVAAFNSYLASSVSTGDAYKACVYAAQTSGDPPFSLVNPSHVCFNQVSETTGQQGTGWSGTFGQATQTSSNWSVEFNLNGSNPSPLWNGGYAIGTSIPNGTTVSGVTGSSPTLTLTIPSSAESNPFGPAGETIDNFFVFYDSSDSTSSAFPSPLLTFFDEAIYNLFQADNPPIKVSLSVPQPGSNPPANEDVVFHGVVTTAMHKDNKANLQSYKVLQFTGTANPAPKSNSSPVSYVLDIFYPFFSTNSMFSSPIYATANPPPPPLALVGKGAHHSPSTMVFACNGVFADSNFRNLTQPQTALLAALENAVVSTLVRGTSGNLIYAHGTITPNSSVNTATVTPKTGTNFSEIGVGLQLFSNQIASVPMQVMSVSPDGSTLQVVAPSPISQTTDVFPNAGLLTFSNFYPSPGTWSAYSGFWHNATIGGQPIYINNRGYTFAYDDQGGFSSDLTSQWKLKPTTVSITLQPWLASS